MRADAVSTGIHLPTTVASIAPSSCPKCCGVDLWTLAILLLGVLAALDSARRHSPTYDETLHVVAGLAYWEHGRWDVYPHNPPLVKLCLSAPWLMTRARLQPDWFNSSPQVVFRLGAYFHNRYRDDFDALYFRSRVISILFYAWGAWLIGLWAGEMFGIAARRGAVALWCFQPLVLAHASVATPDMGAAVIALAALRSLSRFLPEPTWSRALTLGLWIGVAQASKFTLVLLYPIFAVIVVAHLAQTALMWRDVTRRGVRLFAAFCLSLIPLAAAYGFCGLAQPLERAEFISPTMRAVQGQLSGTPLAWGALFVPSHYLHGFDLQTADLDGRWINYLNGHESNVGWLAYYPLALALKTPVGFWLVVVLAVAACRRVRGRAADETSLALMPLLLFLFLWSNTSLTFMRYLLPCYPPAFVWLGRVFSDSHRRRRVLASWLAAFTVPETLSQHPHYLGYFDRLFGGPRVCWPVFADGEIDWGQDLPALARWQHGHPEARPMRLALFTP